MKPQPQLETVTPTPFFVEADRLLGEFEQLHEAINRRAFDLFNERGKSLGHELDDWFAAEAEFLRPLPVEITETDTAYMVKAEVPGFTEKEVQISVEPHRLILRGRRQTADRKEDEGQVVWTERSEKNFFRAIPLNAEVNPAAVKTTHADGILTLTLPKILPPETTS
jgi:HSP20 family protein